LHKRSLDGDRTAGRCRRQILSNLPVKKSSRVTLIGLLDRLQGQGGRTGLFGGEKRLVGSLQDHAAEIQDEGAVG
jgi:hypothetical protein